MRRTPKNYRGTTPTSRHIRSILPTMVASFTETYEKRGDLVLLAWPSVIGAKFAPMTRAMSFVSGVLKVRVANSSLLGLLTEHEKPRLIKELQERLPKAGVKNIHFFIG